MRQDKLSLPLILSLWKKDNFDLLPIFPPRQLGTKWRSGMKQRPAKQRAGTDHVAGKTKERGMKNSELSRVNEKSVRPESITERNPDIPASGDPKRQRCVTQDPHDRLKRIVDQKIPNETVTLHVNNIWGKTRCASIPTHIIPLTFLILTNSPSDVNFECGLPFSIPRSFEPLRRTTTSPSIFPAYPRMIIGI
jgi:hypothetical protein